MLDATVAGASANSYLTVAAADDLAKADLGLNAKDWLAATVEAKEAALQRATTDVDEEVGRVATPATTTQSLLFPRYADRLADQVTLALPVRLVRAVYVQAAFLIGNADLVDQAASRRARGLSNFANPDGTSGQIADDPDFGRLHPRVRKLLGEFTEGSLLATIIPT